MVVCCQFRNYTQEERYQLTQTPVTSEPELVVTSTMLKYGEVLRKDKTFMEIVERGTSRKDDHNVAPFPFCDPNLILLNNKKQPIQRSMGTKRRFMKD